MSKKLLKKLKKITRNDMAFVANEEDNMYVVKEYTDIGCYMLNACLSGDIFGGIADGKRYMFAGPSSTAKSYFTAFCLKAYLDKHKNAQCLFFESEGATLLKMLDSVGADISRIHIFPISTVEQFRDQSFRFLEERIKEIEEDGNKDDKYIICLDSLGMLSTENELKQIREGSLTKDMSKPGLLRAIGRAISLKLSIAKIPLLVVNHSYTTMEMFSSTKVSGGEGPLYMADVVLVPTKGKEKEGTKQVGAKFGVGIFKSRLGKEGLRTHIIIHFEKGLYKYSDLEEYGKKLGVFGKEGNSYILPDGQKVKTTTLRKNFKDYANETNMNALAEAIGKEFQFGQIKDDGEDIKVEDIIEVEDE